MFTLELSSDQVQAREGFIILWAGGDKITRVTFELSEPSRTKTETIAKSIPLQRMSAKLFGGFEGRGARIEFTNLGTLTRVTPFDQV